MQALCAEQSLAVSNSGRPYEGNPGCRERVQKIEDVRCATPKTGASERPQEPISPSPQKNFKLVHTSETCTPQMTTRKVTLEPPRPALTSGLSHFQTASPGKAGIMTITV